MKATKAQRRARRQKSRKPWQSRQQRMRELHERLAAQGVVIDEAQSFDPEQEARWQQICEQTKPGTKNDYVGRKALSFPGRTQQPNDCAHVLTTVHREPGVTPMFLTCKCGGQLVSTGYAPTDREPTMEWYTPSDVELSKASIAEIDHVARGGVLIRPIITADQEATA